MTGTSHHARPLRRVRRDVAVSPFIVIWEATRACPPACLHCRAEAVPDRHPLELTTGEAYRLIDQVAAFGTPAPLFVITGGDPFERPDDLRLPIARLRLQRRRLRRGALVRLPAGELPLPARARPLCVSSPRRPMPRPPSRAGPEVIRDEDFGQYPGPDT